MEIIPLIYGKSVLPESMIFKDGDKDLYRDILFKVYLVKDGERVILLDAGCETMPGFDMKDFIGPVKALKDINIQADEITDVIITHSHHDHIESVKYFKNAIIYIEEDELSEAMRYIPSEFNVKVFKDEFYLTPNIKIVKIGGHSLGSSVVEIKKDNETLVFAGDECYLRECLTKKIPTGTSVCPEKSEFFINKYSSDKYTVLLAHDV